jgi:CRISPR-associated protein Cas2
MTERRHYVIAYDISDDKRRNEIYTALCGAGDHAQFSVFLCELDHRELAALRSRLRVIINYAEDQIIILDLGRAERPLDERLQVLGRGYEPSVRTVVI